MSTHSRSRRAEGLPEPRPAVVPGQKQLAGRALPAGFRVRVDVHLDYDAAGPLIVQRVLCPPAGQPLIKPMQRHFR